MLYNYSIRSKKIDKKKGRNNMMIDMETVISEELERQLEDLYVEYLGDNCPLVVDWAGQDGNLAVVVFKDYEYPGMKLLVGQELDTGAPMIELQQGISAKQWDRMKFIRKHEKTVEIIREQWFPLSTLFIK